MQTSLYEITFASVRLPGPVSGLPIVSACTNKRSAHPLEKYSWKQKIHRNFSEKSTTARSQQTSAIKDYITRFLTDENQNDPRRTVLIRCKCIKIIQLKQDSRAGAPGNQQLRRDYQGRFDPPRHSSLLSCLSRWCSRNGLASVVRTNWENACF